MPYILLAALGGAIGLVLVRTGHVTAERLVAAFYALIGGMLGIVILRVLAGGLGPIGAILGAIAGAVVLLYLAQSVGRKKGD